MIAEFIKPQDPQWMDALSRTKYDFYHLPEYVEFTAKYEGGLPIAFYASEGDCEFLAPMILREISTELTAGIADESLFDAISPYGYPTPLLIGNDDRSKPAFIDAALESLISVGKQEAIVSAFFRMHPLIPFFMDKSVEHGTVVHHGQTVYLDLILSDDELWQQFHREKRRRINKFNREGFKAVIDDWSLYGQLMGIYRSTMSRKFARDYYMFSDDYFLGLRSVLGGSLHLCTILSPTGDIAAACVFTAVNGIVQYHLSGTAERYLRLAPSILVIDAIRRWGKENGNTLLHLGGGLGGESDSLFEFKSHFSHKRANFYTFRMILDSDKYSELTCAHSKRCRISGVIGDEFFPEYRRPFDLSPAIEERSAAGDLNQSGLDRSGNSDRSLVGLN